jgi:catechol 2,3-dioxygenase-like lactoylglutathione lyase family enzyme
VGLLTAYVDALNAGEQPSPEAFAARLGEPSAAFRDLLRVAAALSVRPDATLVEVASARLAPWKEVPSLHEPRDAARSDVPPWEEPHEASRSDVPPWEEPPTAPWTEGPLARERSSGPRRDDRAQPAPATASGAAPQPSVLEIAALDHVALPVSDLDRAIAFYTQVLGLRVLREARTPPPPTTPHVEFELGAVRLSVFLALGQGEPTPRTRRAGAVQYPHLALQVREPVAALRRLRASGYPFEGPLLWGAGQAQVYLRDPDGNQLEFSLPWPEAAAP